MSAYVTYNLKAADVDGVVLGQLDVRAVCMPDRDHALELAREKFGDVVGSVECKRSVPAKIGRVTPAARRTTVSARVKVLALPGQRLSCVLEGTMYHVTISVYDRADHRHQIVDEHDVEDGSLAARQVESARGCGLDAYYEEVEPAA